VIDIEEERKHMKLQRLGGYAAIASVCAILVSLALVFLRLQRIGDLNDPIQAMSAMSSSPAEFYFNNVLVMVMSILLMIVIFALNERMQADAPNLTRMAIIAASIATALGILSAVARTYAIELIVPTNDVSAYRAFDAITTSIWSASGSASGWAGLLTGCAVLKTRTFQKTPAWLIIWGGLFWVRIPFPVNIGNIGIIAWLLWCMSILWFGIEMLRHKQPQSGLEAMAALK
jgi:hypothetical protein